MEFAFSCFTMSAPNDLVFEDFSGCLIVRASGGSMIGKVEATLLTIAETARSRSVKTMLVDMRSVEGPVTFMDRFKIGELAGKHLAGFQLAVLAREEQTDKNRIGQLVARNRGAQVEAIFTDEASALAWLKKHAEGRKPDYPVI